MKLNCKPGDLAIVVRSEYGNVGKIVRVIKPSLGNAAAQGTEFREHDGQPWLKSNNDYLWFIECESGIRASNKKTYTLAPGRDISLRPLRNSEGEDEMLRVAGKPNKEIAA